MKGSVNIVPTDSECSKQVCLSDSRDVVRFFPFTYNNIFTFLACLWIIVASLGPDSSSLLGIIKIRFEDILIIVMSLLIIIKMRRHKISLDSLQLTFKIAIFFAALCVISILSMYVNSFSPETISIQKGTFGYDKNIEIMKEFTRFSKYMVVAFAFSQMPSESWKYSLIVLVMCCLIMIGIQLLQYLMPDFITPVLNEIYEGGSKDSYLGPDLGWLKEGKAFRAGSLMINPNVFGAYLTAPLFIFIMNYFEAINSPFFKERKNRLLWLTVSCFTLLGLFLTQSRTMFISIVLAMIITLMFIPSVFRRKISRLIIGAITISIIFSAIFANSTDRYTLEGLARGVMEESFKTKLTLTFDSIHELGDLIVIGAGPAGAERVDNEFGYILTWYGFIGLLTYIIFYAALYTHISQRIKNIYQRAAFRGILSTYLIGSLGATFLLNNRVFPIFIALLSLSCAKSIPISARPIK